MKQIDMVGGHYYIGEGRFSGRVDETTLTIAMWDGTQFVGIAAHFRGIWQTETAEFGVIGFNPLKEITLI